MTESRHVRRRVARLATGLYRKLKPHVRGRRIPRNRDFSLAVPFAIDVVRLPPPKFEIAVVCHLFYPELAEEMWHHIAFLPCEARVFVSTDTAAKADRIKSAFRGRDGLEVRVVSNRGRDIAPKLCAFRDVYDAFEIVLFLHGKKTPEYAKGDAWRRTLIGSLAGSDDTVRSILAIFESQPDVGMVISQHFEPIRPFIGWHHNFSAACRLGKRMGIELTPAHALDMPSGSMFWTRSAAIRPLLDLGLTIEDFPQERGQTNGTTAHAIERLFLYVCETAGFKWVKVCDPSLFGDKATIRCIDNLAALDRFVAHEGKSLTSHHW